MKYLKSKKNDKYDKKKEKNKLINNLDVEYNEFYYTECLNSISSNAAVLKKC